MGLSALGFSCLPQGVALVWLDNGEDMLLITRVKGSEGRRLVPFSRQASELGEHAKQLLLADADLLAAKNQALSSIAEMNGSWRILEGENRIVFSRCEIAFLPDKAKPAYRRRVLKTLGLSE